MMNITVMTQLVNSVVKLDTNICCTYISLCFQNITYGMQSTFTIDQGKKMAKGNPALHVIICTDVV